MNGGSPKRLAELFENVTIDDFVRAVRDCAAWTRSSSRSRRRGGVLVGAAEVLRRSASGARVELNAAALDASGATPAHVEELLLAAELPSVRDRQSDARLVRSPGLAEFGGQNIVLPRETANDSR